MEDEVREERRRRRVVTRMGHVGVSLPEDMITWLDLQAEAKRINRSLLLRLIILWAQEHWEERKLELR